MSRTLARGHEVVFPRNAAMEIGLAGLMPSRSIAD
jgi:hypothetical protein